MIILFNISEFWKHPLSICPAKKWVFPCYTVAREIYIHRPQWTALQMAPTDWLAQVLNWQLCSWMWLADVFCFASNIYGQEKKAGILQLEDFMWTFWFLDSLAIWKDLIALACLRSRQQFRWSWVEKTARRLFTGAILTFSLVPTGPLRWLSLLINLFVCLFVCLEFWKPTLKIKL